MAQDGLALGLIPGVGWRAAEIRRVAREAEEAGFAAVFAAEVNNDVLATVELMGEATQRIQVGSWVANIYLRHPYVFAQAAALIADATGGRMLLGLGVSHQPINSALDVVMGSPTAALRDYANRGRELVARRGASDAFAATAVDSSGADLFRGADLPDRRACRRNGRWHYAGMVVARAGCP